jgi:hypothetical protein
VEDPYAKEGLKKKHPALERWAVIAREFCFFMNWRPPGLKNVLFSSHIYPP